MVVELAEIHSEVVIVTFREQNKTKTRNFLPHRMPDFSKSIHF